MTTNRAFFAAFLFSALVSGVTAEDQEIKIGTLHGQMKYDLASLLSA